MLLDFLVQGFTILADLEQAAVYYGDFKPANLLVQFDVALLKLGNFFLELLSFLSRLFCVLLDLLIPFDNLNPPKSKMCNGKVIE